MLVEIELDEKKSENDVEKFIKSRAEPSFISSRDVYFLIFVVVAMN